MGDRYTITERLDHGGMAEVFRGVAESMQGFKKNVAIKRVLPNLTKNDKFVKMFLDEARLSLFLQHANIVQVFDISRTPDNAYFLVMEFVDGCNLKGLIEKQKTKGRPLEVAHTIYLMMECCKALHYAHNLEHPETGEALHIVHRDVSPPNILISKNGEVKLVDFGLAKANSQIERSDPGVVKGKFSYLSPEATLGEEVDHRADVFACGIILWELLTGRRLFFGESDYNTVELVREAAIPSPSAINPSVGAELEAIVRKALAKDRNQRYQSAADLADALAHYLFSHRLKVTARDIAELVKLVQADAGNKKAQQPKASLIDALIMDEMQKMTSLLDGSPESSSSDGSLSLDPTDFDEAQWRPARKAAAPSGTEGSISDLLEPERMSSPALGEPRKPSALADASPKLLGAIGAVVVVLLGLVALLLLR